jgi:hypothetical protein
MKYFAHTAELPDGNSDPDKNRCQLFVFTDTTSQTWQDRSPNRLSKH